MKFKMHPIIPHVSMFNPFQLKLVDLLHSPTTLSTIHGFIENLVYSMHSSNYLIDNMEWSILVRNVMFLL
jgi:hypothetical protein